MTDNNPRGASTQVSRVIKAPRQVVYEAFLDPEAVAAWLPPGNMTGHVHRFEPHPGGALRLSLTYKDVADSPGGKGGKTSDNTDIVQGRFVEFVPNEKIVWLTTFESQDPDFAGEMRITWSLTEVENGTEVTARCEGIPKGIRPEDNEMGTKSTLQQLAQLLE